MKKLVILAAIISLFLVSFAAAISVTSKAIENNSEDNNIQAQTKIQNAIENAFCGTSTLGVCETDEDCIVGGCSNAVCQGKSEEPAVTTCEYRECYNAEKYNAKCVCKKNKCIWNKLTQNQITSIIHTRNKIKFGNLTDCPTKCTCTGSVIKCLFANGTREMTVVAGKSGNIIVQIKGVNASTKVVLYKSEDGKLYGVFKNNETRIVRMFPDQVKERIRARIKARLQNENITLNEDGDYDYKAEKKARLFFIIPVRVAVKAKINSETGDITDLKGKWWAFLARDEKEEELLGASCGTVTPGYNDECCKNKGYDVWNITADECEFDSSE